MLKVSIRWSRIGEGRVYCVLGEFEGVIFWDTIFVSLV